MTLDVALVVVGLALLAVGITLGATVLFGPLGLAASLTVFGAASCAVGLLVDFERG